MNVMYNVFIDGREGTTGLRIFDRLSAMKDISLIVLPEEERKDPKRRAEAINDCDIAFLCLPDDAARESVSFIKNENTKVIDTSTAHRTSPEWVYGFPELSAERRQAVINSKRTAVPGCHASGFIALVAPLVKEGIIAPDSLLSAFSLTGYSGGGKKMIAAYEGEERPSLYDAPRQYGLTQTHKHLPEMKKIAGLDFDPVFVPVVGDFYSGMEVTVPLFGSMVKKGYTKDSIAKLYGEFYNGPVVSFSSDVDEDGFASACAFSGLDSMTLTVGGNDDRLVLIARYDNLGKGASGAAVQCMNLMLGREETDGLILKK